jgi:hypothetical protein
MTDFNEKTSDTRRDSDATATNVEDTDHANAHVNNVSKTERDMQRDIPISTGKARKRSFADVEESQLSAAFENPLAGIEKSQLMKNVEDFCQQNNLTDYVDDFRKGALIAQNPADWKSISELTEEERLVLEREKTHRWSQPKMLYWLVVMCSVCRARSN